MTQPLSSTRWALLAFGIFTFLTLPNAFAQPAPNKLAEMEKQLEELQKAVEDLRQNPPSTNAPERGSAGATNRMMGRGSSNRTNDPIARIREEGLEHSKVRETLSYLTDVIGPRLTGSPNLKRANEWTRGRLEDWGLTNAQLEAWGPFGRGWSLKRFSAQIIEPQAIPLIGFPKAWSPGLDQPLVADVVYLDAKGDTDLEKFKGKLHGAIVLSSPAREIKAHFEPLANRMMETNLLRLANASEAQTFTLPFSSAAPPEGGRTGIGAGRRGGSNSVDGARLGTNLTRNTGGTDHTPFDAIGLPGFQFIQDPIEYSSRTHHSNADVFDRIQADDLKQAATILAAFAYNAAMLDEKLPRKPQGD